MTYVGLIYKPKKLNFWQRTTKGLSNALQEIRWFWRRNKFVFAVFMFGTAVTFWLGYFYRWFQIG